MSKITALLKRFRLGWMRAAALRALLMGALSAAYAGLANPVVSMSRPQADESALKAALLSAAGNVVNAIEKGRPKDLLESLSSGGLAVGIDADPTDIASIRKQFQEHKLSYCLFFDTDCYRDESNEARKRASVEARDSAELSLMDQFKQHPEKDCFISSFRRDGVALYGGVSIVLDPKLPHAKALASNRIDLGFKYEAGRWRLADLNLGGL